MKRILLSILCLTPLLNFAQFSESFEGGTTTPAGWSIIAGGDAAETWEISDLTTSTGITAQNGTKTFSINYGSSAHNDILVTPQFVVTAGVSDKLTFWGRSRDPNYPETISVVASTTTATAAAFTTILSANVAPASGASYYKYTIDLTSLVGQSIYIGFKSTTTDMFIFDVDNVVVGSTVSCIEPTSMPLFSAIGTVSATVSWTAATPAPSQGYDIYFSTNAVAPTAATAASLSVGAGVTTANLPGLTSGSKYYVYVRSKCSAVSSSVWGHLGLLFTEFTPVTPPYAYGFDTATGFVSDGWTGTWPTNNAAGNPQAGGQMIYSNNSNAAVTNRWMFSRPITLTANSTNTITFYTRNFSAASLPQSLKLTVASTNVAADHAALTPVWSSTTLNNTTWVQVTATFVPTTTGVYFFGINHFSPIQASAVSLGLDTFALNSVLSTDEFTKNSFTVSPNPSSDFINITNNKNILVNGITVVDLNGRTVKQVNYNNVSEIRLNISDLSTGMYMMTISSEFGSVTKKIVKK